MKPLASLGIALLLFCSTEALAAPLAPCGLCPPALDSAGLAIGAATFSAPDSFTVPLLVSTVETVTFSQLTVVYDSTLMFMNAEVGASVVFPGIAFVDDRPAGGGKRQVLVAVAGEYTG